MELEKERASSEPVAGSASERLVIHGLRWHDYDSIARALDETNVRINYDDGTLELMRLCSRHERLKRLVGQFVSMLTLELRIPIRSAGSWTLRREELDRGAESDDCYYVEHEPAVRGRDEIDLAIDPPPDLGIEIEVSRSVLNRMAIFAAMRVSELWCYDGSRLRVYLLNDRGEYVESETSRCFPFLPVRQLESFLNRRTETDETSLVGAFRAWVREQITAGHWRTADAS